MNEEKQDVVQAVAQVLEEVCQQQGQFPLTPFQVSIAPIPLEAYLQNFWAGNFAPYVLALIYMDRSQLPVRELTVRKLMSVAMLLAYKYLEDNPMSNKEFSQRAWLPVKELNALEGYFLKKLDFNCYVAPRLFESDREHVASICAITKEKSKTHLFNTT